MTDKTLLTVLDEVRGKTLKLLEGVSEAQARWAPPGLQNTILWHGGHAYCLLEHLGLATLGRQPVMPEGWFEMFSWKSQPAKVAAERWPTLAEVAGQLRGQHQRARAVLEATGAEQLGQGYQGPNAYWAGKTVGFIVFHGLHDEALHGGEVLVLRKLQGIGVKRG
jgi:hypothetical protein